MDAQLVAIVLISLASLTVNFYTYQYFNKIFVWSFLWIEKLSSWCFLNPLPFSKLIDKSLNFWKPLPVMKLRETLMYMHACIIALMYNVTICELKVKIGFQDPYFLDLRSDLDPSWKKYLRSDLNRSFLSDPRSDPRSFWKKLVFKN